MPDPQFMKKLRDYLEDEDTRKQIMEVVMGEDMMAPDGGTLEDEISDDADVFLDDDENLMDEDVFIEDDEEEEDYPFKKKAKK